MGEDKSSKIALASVSAMVAETTTFPIDITKTRLQLHRSTTQPVSAFQVAAGIVRKQGLLGLYKGLSPALIRHLFYTPIRTVGYEHLRHAFIADPNQSLSLPTKALLGGISGVIAQVKTLIFVSANSILVSKSLGPIVQVVASPADLVKVRMQADGGMVRYTGPIDALNKIISTQGFTGLWRGVVPNVQRAFLVNMGELACYDQAKHLVVRNGIANDNIYAHTLASVMSGLSATTISCPADVVKTRMMNQQGQVLYTNSFDCLAKTIKVEGMRALWKGFFPTWARLGPWQFVFWVSYEKLRFIAGLPSF